MNETVEHLLSLPDDEFRAEVEAEVRKSRGGHHSARMRPLLGNERLADRWREALLACKHQLTTNLVKEDRERLEHVRGLIIEIATVKSLQQFSEEDFQDVVDGEARRMGGRYLRSLLASPALIERWRLALVQMKKNVESQMGARADDVKTLLIEIDNPQCSHDEKNMSREEMRAARIEHHRSARADFVKWRAGAKRFKLGVEERLLDIRQRMLQEGAFKADEHTATLYMLQTLVNGIKAHQAQLLAEVDENDISDSDKELWALLPTSA